MDGLTIIVIAAEVTTTDGELLSVTRSSKDQLPTIASAPVETDREELQLEELPKLV